jgi:hypothetical protein
VGILAACGTAVEVDPATKAAECKELGFDTALLACSSCALIPSFVDDAALVAECRQCCRQEETTDDDRVFDHARVEMDKSLAMALSYYHPGLFRFFRSSLLRFPGVQVVDKPSTKPTLVFLGADGEPQLTTPLDGWKEDTIVEYLEAKLTDKVGKPLADAEQVPRWLRALVESRH